MTTTVPATEAQAPMSRRDVWLTVALAIARDGLPAPQDLRHHPGGWYILEADTAADARAWGEHLGLANRHYDGHAWAADWHGHSPLLGGADVSVRCMSEPALSPLAEQVIAAVEATS